MLTYPSHFGYYHSVIVTTTRRVRDRSTGRNRASYLHA